MKKTTVLITTKGEVKRVNNYKKTTAVLLSVIDTNTTSTICVFTNKGICRKIPVKKIPLVIKNSEKGEKLIDFGFDNDETILFAIDMKNLKGTINLVTQLGYIKAIDAEECNSNRTCKYTTLKDNDKVVYCGTKKEVKFKTNKKDRVFKDFLILKRTATGNRLKDWKADERIG